jgi:solute carrier family 30 (zinc transporter), member 2
MDNHGPDQQNHHDHHHDHHHQSNDDIDNDGPTTTTKKPRMIHPHDLYLDHRHDHDTDITPGTGGSSSGGGRRRVVTKLRVALAILASFLVVEIMGGYVAQSLAIWSDAAHLMADMAAIVVALLAAHVGSFPVSEVHTFGLQRVESMAALFSTLSLLLISVGLAVEAVRRLWLGSYYSYHVDSDSSTDGATTTSAATIDGRLMSIIAFIGVLVNVALACVLGEHHVHLPSDDGGHCSSHDHSHDHHHHDTTTSVSTVATTIDTIQTCREHSHDHHDDHTKNGRITHNDHPVHSNHASAALHPSPSETTPLLVPRSSSNHATNATTTTTTTTTEGDPTRPKKQPWKIPFSPDNINLQAAYLHVLGDLAQSAAVFLAGCIIWIFPTWTMVDPICTIVFCILVISSAWGVVRTSVAVLIQEVPSHLQFHRIRDRIAMVKGVHNVHELHIWSISHGVPALTVHCTIANGVATTTNPTTTATTTTTNATTATKHMHDVVLEKIYEVVSREFGIRHATIQIQSIDGDCITCVDRLCGPCMDEATITTTTTPNQVSSVDDEEQP